MKCRPAAVPGFTHDIALVAEPARQSRTLRLESPFVSALMKTRSCQVSYRVQPLAFYVSPAGCPASSSRSWRLTGCGKSRCWLGCVLHLDSVLHRPQRVSGCCVTGSRKFDLRCKEVLAACPGMAERNCGQRVVASLDAAKLSPDRTPLNDPRAPDGPCRSPARVGCFPSRPRALPPFPSSLSASPPDSRAGSQALPPRPSAAGGRGAKRAAACPQARCRLLMSAPCPHGTETRSGVGRVARRARLAAKPFFRPLPRLTLKAGHKAGLPTTPPAACGA